MKTDLPVHPRTGLRAVGIGKRGPIWPIFGAEDNPPAPPAAEPPKPGPPPSAQPPAGDPPKPADPPKGDEPLGERGLKALQAERDARRALEKQLEGLAPLQKLAEALGTTGEPGGTGKSEIEQITERLANHEQQLAEANQARWRAEVANAKKLTPEQATELRGSTAEELAAHADRLLALFPAAPAAPGTPKPDPSQGGLGGSGVNLDAQIAEAQAKGDWRAVLSLQNQKLANAKP